MIKINLENYGSKDFESGVTYKNICEQFNLTEEILAVKANSEIMSLCEVVSTDENLSLVIKNSLEGSNIYKNGLRFIFLVALKKVFPNYDAEISHSVPKGMFIKLNGKVLTSNDISKITNEMKKIINNDLHFNKINLRNKDALSFLNKTKEFEKANNISNISDPIVNLFELDGIYNYFYSEMPYSTKVINKFDIVYLGNNNLVLVTPDSDGNLDYVHYDGIIDAYKHNGSWLRKMNVEYVSKLNLGVGNGSVKDFIKSNEIVYDMSVLKVAEEIVGNSNIKFVLIAGPSSSGKTTTTKRLANYLKTFGYDPIKISTDDYFVDREFSPRNEKGEIDFECLEAIDLKYLNNDISKLLNDEIIVMPTYNFITGKKELTNKSVKLKSNSIILIEGLHSLNDDLLTVVKPDNKYKIYLSPFTSLKIDRHNYVSSIDLRLMRRIVRDNKYRGYGVATTLHNWQIVRNGENKYIFPYVHQANAIINTALEYEVGVLKVYIEPLLLSVSVNSPYYAEAQRLIRFLKQFFAIPSEYVNSNSIIREFIGGLDD